MISLARMRGGGSFPSFSLIGELVQVSALFRPWMHLGSMFLMVMDPDSCRDVWGGEDGIGHYCPWVRGGYLCLGWSVFYGRVVVIVGGIGLGVCYVFTYLCPFCQHSW